MFGNNKKFNEINGRIDGIVKGAAIAFGVKTVIDIAHGVATAKNTIDINRLNRLAAGVPTDKDVQRFDDIATKWKNKTAPAAPAPVETAAAPVTPADDTVAPATPATPPTAAAPAAPATPPTAAAPAAPATPADDTAAAPAAPATPADDTAAAPAAPATPATPPTGDADASKK